MATALSHLSSSFTKPQRRVIIQNGETILLLWSPAEGAYTEGLVNAKLTQDGCIVCLATDSTFDLRTGAIKAWYLRALIPTLKTLYVYPVKYDQENIYIGMRGTPGVSASGVNVDEVKMMVDEDLDGFGFTVKNELINGKATIIGFLLLLDFELLTGKGLLKGTGFLDFIYAISNALK
ncbi:hypothetical protein K2173_026221 [Erythroxylum novogranatense]|uniref:Uncharacterized protein n=1 Tax=Erythroxylum novogranatense TaxID=1862640 RepID=A0AAV8SBH8_9ROSI|nr:hypothetical protein K2173_026221 [Erythroxylum novogranatense]